MADITANYPQEIKERYKAALTLASIKHTEFDYKTLSTIEKLKKKFTKIQKRKNPSPRTHLPLIQDQELPGYTQIWDRKKIMKLIDEYTPPIIPPVESLRGVIGECSRPFEKQLTESDVKDELSRLGINKSDLEQFLMPMLKANENLEKGVPVNVYDRSGKKFKMVFKVWSSSKLCVLTNGWSAFSNEHGLIGNQDFVTLWMFRHNKSGKLCFVLFSRRLPVFELLKRNRTVYRTITRCSTRCFYT